VELLVVVAVIALLIGVLLPALAGARSQGFQMKGAANQKQMVLGIIRWGNDNDLKIPGTNTSGRSLENIDDQDSTGKLSRSADKPVQNWDWISPAIGTDTLSEPRAERFIRIWTEYGDPTVSDIVSTAGVKNANTKLTAALDAAGGMPAPSILMPASWQWAGSAPGTTNITQPSAEEDVAKLPTNWFPRMTNIGGESLKVAISDGYVNLDTFEIDGAIWSGNKPTIAENQYGAFCSSSPIKEKSINFFGQNPDPKNANTKAFRHKDKMNAGFWDGHVTTLGLRDSQNPALWYPKGTVLGNSGLTAAAKQIMKTGDTIN